MVTLNRNRVYSNFGFKGGIRFGIGNAKPTRKWNIFELARCGSLQNPHSEHFRVGPGAEASKTPTQNIFELARCGSLQNPNSADLSTKKEIKDGR